MQRMSKLLIDRTIDEFEDNSSIKSMFQENTDKKAYLVSARMGQ